MMIVLATACTLSSSGPLYNTYSNAAVSTTWTLSNDTFTASSSTSTLKIDAATNGKWTWFLDDISVKDSSSNELLVNGNFESGSLSIGWLSFDCGTACTLLTTGSTCRGGSGSCYRVTCSSNQFLQQAFTTVTGHTYTFSFWVKIFNQGPGVGSSFSMNIGVV